MAKRDLPTVIRTIRQELRSILRQLDDLSLPLREFSQDQSRPKGRPQYYVRFDSRPHRPVQGLAVSMAVLKLPDERIVDAALNAAQSLWHFKDYLKRWISIKQLDVDLEKVLNSCPNLLLCADLANRKKHGENRNRSVHDPYVELVNFDLSNSGVIEFYYEGDIKDKEILVTHPNPIMYTVPLMNSAGDVLANDVRTVYQDALNEWRDILVRLRVLEGNDRESVKICSMLELPLDSGGAT